MKLKRYVPKLKSSIQSKKSKRSQEKYDYKSIRSIYEGGKGNSNMSSKRESIKPKGPLLDEINKNFAYLDTEQTPVN